MRVSACNLAGFGPCVPSTPPSATPSSRSHTWLHTTLHIATDSVHTLTSRSSLLTVSVDPLSYSMAQLCSHQASLRGQLQQHIDAGSSHKELLYSKLGSDYTHRDKLLPLTKYKTEIDQKRNIQVFWKYSQISQKFKTVSSTLLISFTSVLVKASVVIYSPRGLYLALVYHSDDDRILVTTDDNIPIVEVGDEYNRGTLGADISWLNRVSCVNRMYCVYCVCCVCCVYRMYCVSCVCTVCTVCPVCAVCILCSYFMMLNNEIK